MTSNKKHVLSVQKVTFENSLYIFTSGNSQFIDIFRMQDLICKDASGKYNILLDFQLTEEPWKTIALEGFSRIIFKMNSSQLFVAE